MWDAVLKRTQSRTRTSSPCKPVDGFIGNEIEVRRICEVVESVRDDRQLAVDHLERSYLDLADGKRRIVIDSVRDQLRQSTANMVWLKYVFEYSPEIFPRRLIRVDRHRAVFEIQRTNVIETKNVIDMAMRDQHGIQKFDIRS